MKWLFENVYREIFLILVKSNQLWIVITQFRSIYHQTEIRFVLNQLEKCNYCPILAFGLQDSERDLAVITQYSTRSIVRNGYFDTLQHHMLGFYTIYGEIFSVSC